MIGWLARLPGKIGKARVRRKPAPVDGLSDHLLADAGLVRSQNPEYGTIAFPGPAIKRCPVEDVSKARNEPDTDGHEPDALPAHLPFRS